MATKKLLLKESVKNVGKVGDIVDVAPGFARNYLLPRDLAVEPTPSNVKKMEARKAEVERIERERLDRLAEQLKKMEGVELTMERRANEQGHLFGSVSATDIAKNLQGLGYEVTAEDVLLPGKLDRIDKYMVTIRYAQDLQQEIKIYVAPDAESKAAMEEAAKNRPAAPADEAPARNFERSAK